MTSRIKDAALAANITPETLAWREVICPVTAAYGRYVAKRDLRGKTIVSFQHVLEDTIPTLLPFVQAGARVKVGACNPDSTDDAAAAYLAANGVEVHAFSGMTPDEYAKSIDILSDEPADIIADMGGELIEAFVKKGHKVEGALEATTTGVHRVEKLALNFPVFNWNDIAIKDRLHNRHHVAQEMWPVFSNVTGLALYGRTVLVIGFGPVGRGVAERARNLGAVVSVAERDPVRALEAQHHGCAVVDLETGLKNNAIIVTATGLSGILGKAQLSQVRRGAVLVNVGHSNTEIDVAWLDTLPRTRMRRHIERFDLDENKQVYLLNRGSLLNLAPGMGGSGKDLFDPFSAILLRGIDWLASGGAASFKPGFWDYPADLEVEIAQRILASHS
ncbi:S-adenosyl-L-homocysteine hydrolase [Thalassospira profundimaris]|uniref:S-adenosyl-L-homocysteine hydrolase n=1 Tax=Thalassospira profundimaris TaxID=502049 RepID=A0A367X204_9PROT|nr:adenosylhomocysteinase [Thalassospira profundimaris]RCK47706.1 S-adenosyl-L-homocysteine hydrolase [Thalassospira profundimaris]